jgi:hypothetical protein
MQGWFVIGVMCAVAAGCDGSPGPSAPLIDGAAVSDGAVGHDGPTTSVDGPAPTAVTCNPGEELCNGNHLWSCTLSGHDATHVEDCGAGGTATNPGTCATLGCPGGGHACCKREGEPCEYSVTSPLGVAGTCFPPQATLNPSCGSLSFSVVMFPAPAPNVCSSDIFEVIVSIDRTKHAVGTGFSPGTSDVLLYAATTMGVSASCSSWTGNVQWISDVPSWRVDVDLTCTTTGTIHLVGTFHGKL